MAAGPANVADAKKKPKSKPKPDLTVTAVSSTPSKLARGKKLTVKATVANSGKANAGASTLALYLAHARTRARNDAKLGSLPISSLKKGKKAGVKKALTVPASLKGGKYFLIACADAAGKVKEKNEKNNCRTAGSATTVTVPAPPPGSGLPGSDKPVPPAPPAPQAPALSSSGTTTMSDASSFLYTGAHPLQTGVSSGTIDAARVGVIRGRVLQSDGSPLPSVTVTIAGHPELGKTVTRSDGKYDLAVNAGGPLTLHFDRPTYLPVDRNIDPSTRDWEVVDDVVMHQFDAKVTSITPGGAGMQVAQSSTTTDSSGSREAKLIFTPGTHAAMRFPNGTTQPLSALHVRATEYTVGDRGAASMPGDLPPTSAYTYAVDYTVDEAVNAGAKSVEFDKPVVVYTDNFIGMPVGTVVPSGFYDETKHAWVPEPNGVVLKIVSITGGTANLDVDGDGVADDSSKLTPLGITDAERAQLAKLYSAGAELWRTSLTHFTPLDLNWPYGPPPGSGAPGGAGGPGGGSGPRGGGGGGGGDPSPGCNPASGSAIDCGLQALRESLPVAGTPYTLNYTSARAPKAAQRQIDIPLSGASLPGPIKRIELDVETAGQHTHLDFAPGANLKYLYEWNGRDAYGRVVNTTTNAHIAISYVYDAVYQTTSQIKDAFAKYGDTLSAVKARKEIKFTSRYVVKVGTPPSPPAALGGWTLDVHHALDTEGETVQLGTGDTLAAPAHYMSRLLVSYKDEYDPATESSVYMNAPVWEPDGSLWFEETHYANSGVHTALVRRRAPDGKVTTIASFPEAAYPGYNDALMARAADGGVYLLFGSNNGESPVLDVAPNGNVKHVTAGTLNGSDSPTPNGGDGLPASQVVLEYPRMVASGPDGSLYISELLPGSSTRVQRVDPDGVLRTVRTFNQSASYLAVGPDGSLYIGSGEIHRIDPSGRDEIVLGDHASPTNCCAPGQVAKDANIYSLYGMGVGPDGTFVFSDGDFVWTIDNRGLLVRLGGRAGGHPADLTPTEAAIGADFGGGSFRAQIGVAGDGVIALTSGGALRSIEPAIGGFALDHLVPSRDGREVYRFDKGGRHLSTLDFLTGVPQQTFAYDSEGRLKSVTDRDGRVTNIERDSAGKATAIVAPNGDRTDLTVDSNSDLTSVTRPGSLKTTLSYATGGLLTQETDATGGVHKFTYDSLGFVTKDTDPDNFATTVDYQRVGADGQKITLTEPSGRTRAFASSGDPKTGYTHQVTNAAGAQTTSHYEPDGSVTTSFSDGRTTTVKTGTDPRFGALAHFPADISIKAPSGLTYDRPRRRTTTLSDPNNPFTINQFSDQLQLSQYGQSVSRNYDGASRTFTLTDYAGRVGTETFDAKGHATSIKPDAAVDAQTMTMDSQGRVMHSAQGSISEDYTYDKDRLATLTDGLGHVTRYTYDGAGRTASTQLPGGQTYQFQHDGLDHLTKLTMPSNVFSTLSFTPGGRLKSFVPPGGGSGYVLDYDGDGLPTKTTLPSGRTVSLGRDSGGRITSMTYPGASVGISYTGNDQRPASITRTPTSGTAEGLALAWDGDLLTSEAWSGPASGQYDLAYDINHRLVQTKVTPPSGSANAYTSAITRDDGGLITAQGPFTFTRGGPMGAITAIAGGALSQSQGWDALGRLASRSDTVGSVGTYGMSLTRDAAGRISQRVETVGGTPHTFTYGYDANGQVTDVHRDGNLVEHYAYDADGNRTTRTAGGVTKTATYNSAGRITGLGSAIYGVDQDGFVTQRGGDSFTYSAHHELLSATVGGTTETYAYDGFGRLVARTVGGNAWRYLYGNPDQQLQVTAAVEPNGTLDTLEYTDTGYLFSILRGSTRYYVSTDQVGSPRIVADASGTTVKSVEYTAYGETTDSAPSFQLPIGYAGGIADPEAGIVHMGMRPYDPQSGRFMALDPLWLAGGAANMFAYAAGDPIQRSDPVGLVSGSFGVCEGVCIGVKPAITSKGISFCVEFGFGSGGGVEVTPGGDLDDNKAYVKAEGSLNAGPVGLDVTTEASSDGNCKSTKTSAKFCLMGVCVDSEDGLTGDPKGPIDALGKMLHLGAEGKIAAGVCQQAKW